MFPNRPYDGYSVVSTGLKCALQARVQLWLVFFPAVSQHGLYMRSGWLACAWNPSDFCLVICAWDIGVRELSVIPGSAGSAVSYERGGQFSLCLCIWCVGYTLHVSPGYVREISIHHFFLFRGSRSTPGVSKYPFFSFKYLHFLDLFTRG